MIKVNQHIIHKVILEIDANSVENAEYFKNNFIEYLKENLLVNLEQKFDDFSSLQDDYVIRIPKLEVNIDLEQNAYQFNNIKEQVIKIIINQIKEVTNLDLVNSGFDKQHTPVIINSIQNNEALFLTFLKNGNLPWWGTNKNFQLDDYQFNEVLDATHLESVKLKERLIKQFANSQLLQFVVNNLKGLNNPNVTVVEGKITKLYKKVENFTDLNNRFLFWDLIISEVIQNKNINNAEVFFTITSFFLNHYNQNLKGSYTDTIHLLQDILKSYTSVLDVLLGFEFVSNQFAQQIGGKNDFEKFKKDQVHFKPSKNESSLLNKEVLDDDSKFKSQISKNQDKKNVSVGDDNKLLQYDSEFDRHTDIYHKKDSISDVNELPNKNIFENSEANDILIVFKEQLLKLNKSIQNISSAEDINSDEYLINVKGNIEKLYLFLRSLESEILTQKLIYSSTSYNVSSLLEIKKESLLLKHKIEKLKTDLPFTIFKFKIDSFDKQLAVLRNKLQHLHFQINNLTKNVNANNVKSEIDFRFYELMQKTVQLFQEFSNISSIFQVQQLTVKLNNWSNKKKGLKKVEEEISSLLSSIENLKIKFKTETRQITQALVTQLNFVSLLKDVNFFIQSNDLLKEKPVSSVIKQEYLKLTELIKHELQESSIVKSQFQLINSSLSKLPLLQTFESLVLTNSFLIDFLNQIQFIKNKEINFESILIQFEQINKAFLKSKLFDDITSILKTGIGIIQPNSDVSKKNKVIDKLLINQQKIETDFLDKGIILKTHKKRLDELGLANEVFIDNAGLIITHPYLKYFFSNVDLYNEEKKEIVNPEKAAHLLHFIATNQEQDVESNMLFEKILCGIPIDYPIHRFIHISKKEKEESKNMLKAVLSNWEKMENASLTLLQNEFLTRKGKLSINKNLVTLKLERKPQDILLNKINWNISMVKLPWLETMIHVEW